MMMMMILMIMMVVMMMMMVLVIMMVMDGLQSLARDPGTLSKLTVLPCGGLGVDSDTYWNELHTSR